MAIEAAHLDIFNELDFTILWKDLLVMLAGEEIVLNMAWYLL